MLTLYVAVVCSLISISICTDLSFPPNFKFGAATSAYQVEGGWNADGKGKNMWDRLVQDHSYFIQDNSNGNIAADSYHLWRQDVEIAVKLGLKFYRFSINWPRILPNGFNRGLNEAGVKYYSDLIDALLAEGIEPIVTLYHWEMPIKIQDLGGWANPLIVKWFGDYVRVIYSLYADRVKTWLTINEPAIVCDIYYNVGIYNAGYSEPEFGPFLCNKHVMLAHATAYRIFDQEFRPKYEGRISIVNILQWIEPLTPHDTDLAELGRQHQAGRYSHPIYSKNGGWPPSIEKVMLEYSLKQGYKESRLPAFTEEEIAFIRGTADFYAMNHYGSSTIRPLGPGEDVGIWFDDGSPEINAKLGIPPNATINASSTSRVYPEGIRRQLNWLKEQYGDIDILITENGYSSTNRQLNDYDRIDYINKYLEQVLLAIKVDKVNVIGYGVWSLIDTFEWTEGYTVNLGLNRVDFNDPTRPRIPRLSSVFYGCVIKHNTLYLPNACFDVKEGEVH